MGQVHHASATTTAAFRQAIQHSQESLRALAKRHAIDPPPLKWSALKYGFESLKEDGLGKTTQAGRDRREAAAG
jgi:hypothetical protein